MTETFHERMSGTDASFLRVESDVYPMHVGALMIFEGGPMVGQHGEVDRDRLMRHVTSLVGQIPRLRQRVHWMKGLRYPVWVDDPHFELRYHVRHTALPYPGDERQLKRLAGRVLSQHLDRRRPLWEMWIIEGLEDGGFALLWKVHHCVTDGVGAQTIMAGLFAPEQEEPTLPSARLPPGDLDMVRQEVQHRVAGLAQLDKIRALWAADDDGSQLWEGLNETLQSGLRSTPVTPLTPKAIGPHRRFDTLQLPLDDFKLVKRACGATVNDAVLAVVGLGALRYLQRRGTPSSDLEPFRVVMPANVRQKGDAQLGNRVSSAFIELPLASATEDPLAFVSAIHQRTERVKKHHGAIEATAAMERIDDQLALGLVPGTLRLSAHLRTFSTTVTNVPGPPIPMKMLGATLRQIYGLVPLVGPQALGVTVFSYAGQVMFGLNADWDAMPDLHDLQQDLAAALGVLVDAARAAKT